MKKQVGKERVQTAEEELQVGKRRRDTGGVRVQTRVRKQEVVVDEPLLHEQVKVERVRVDRFVDERPSMREEGDTLVIPIVEEVAVVEKRLLLKEELRITRTSITVRKPRKITLKRTEATIEPLAPRRGED